MKYPHHSKLYNCSILGSNVVEESSNRFAVVWQLLLKIRSLFVAFFPLFLDLLSSN